jgi:5-methyltetrahydrofolate--homocysteine methyltransferase
LINSGFPPEDIVFDPKHDSSAADFIRSCAWIRKNCPGCQIAAGVSNLSSNFRGNNSMREVLHGVFLKHAAEDLIMNRQGE